MDITCKYFTVAEQTAKRSSETFKGVKEGTTVQQFLDYIGNHYGDSFKKILYIEGTIEGKPYRTANIHLNKKRIQWVQDFPEGLETKLKDKDMLYFGLIVGGG